MKNLPTNETIWVPCCLCEKPRKCALCLQFSNDLPFFRFAVMRVNEEAEKEEDDGLDICLNNPGTDALHSVSVADPGSGLFWIPGYGIRDP
jgi:hypothetical protein